MHNKIQHYFYWICVGCEIKKTIHADYLVLSILYTGRK